MNEKLQKVFNDFIKKNPKADDADIEAHCIATMFKEHNIDLTIKVQNKVIRTAFMHLKS